MEALRAGDPQRIGDYWLAGRLGSGGQGVVYDAYDADGRRVAVKVLHANGDRAIRDRFAREATAAGRVSSFCTARVLATDLEGSRPYLVSEYVPGPSLGAAVRDGRRFGGDDLHRLATAVATALTAIHDAGVVHRDLKPDNVLLGPDGPRVIDFGIARTIDMSLTKTGEVSGTPAYMAPEVFTGQRAGAPADVFAWGAIMVFAATGHDPFGAENLGGVMHRVLSHRPDLGALPPRLAALVEAALDKDPAARPAARDLLLALVSGSGSDTRGLLAAGSRTARGVPGPGHADPALGTIAEDAYESLGPEEREVAAEVFLRLVAVDEDGHEAGRTAGYEELFGGRSERESAAVKRVLEAFSYVIADRDGSVALSRPGLLRAWPRLRMWVDADRDGLAMLNAVNAAARHWAGNGRRDADALQGSRLEQALSWAATGRRHVTLTPLERDFLRAGTELTRRRARRRTLTTVTLALLLVVALVAGGLAVRQRQETARQRDILAAKQVAAEADRMRTVDPALAMLLSVAAWRVSPAQPEARSSLIASLQQQESAVFREPPVKGSAERLLSRDGRTLVSASEGGVNVYDVRTRELTASWPGMKVNGTITGPPALSRSGRLLAETSTEELGVWDLKTGRKLLERRIPRAFEGVYTAVFGEHETTLTLVYAGQEISYLLDVSTGRRFGKGVFEQRGEVAVNDPLVDPSGRHLLLPGGRFDQLSLPGWRPERPFRACVAHPDLAAFSQDGRTLACGDGSEVALVDVASGRTFGDPLTCEVCGAESKLRFSPDGRHLAAYRGRDVQVWDLRTRRVALGYRAEGEPADVAFDPDGRTLRYVVDDAVVSLDLASRTHATAMPGPAFLSPDGRWAALQSGKRLRIWDMNAGKETGSLPIGDDDGEPEEFHGTRLAVSDADGTIALWDVRTLTKLWSTRVSGPAGALTDVHFTPDGRRLATNVVFPQNPVAKEVVLDAADGRRLSSTDTRYQGGPLLPGGTAYASLLGGRFVDLRTGEPVGAGFGPTNAIEFSRSGLMAVNEAATGRIGLWSVDGPTRLSPALPRAADDLLLLAFSPDGRTLASVTEKGALQLWDVEARQRLGGSYRLWEDPVSLAFSADGATLYAGTEDVLHAIPVRSERVAQEVCARAGRSLSPGEWARYLGGVPYQDVCP
ncbi:WD40 repeat domain-containing serine/threonine protein kinase [Nonomuraea jabiensis]|uniref:WD40 repeat protein n=1 Tax=Nonomuraea jabiensis TaxID=882448 RepID=A0A7W9LIN6_9ACTN|nr:WD40 repeat domain-containing serine/threonine protein kinase [Nonomuraea jabiensis]MBB5785230.1 WD40 repeat protein [Nonomuraea jabiensis]